LTAGGTQAGGREPRRDCCSAHETLTADHGRGDGRDPRPSEASPPFTISAGGGSRASPFLQRNQRVEPSRSRESPVIAASLPVVLQLIFESANFPVLAAKPSSTET
jgi:hypothetical protein